MAFSATSASPAAAAAKRQPIFLPGFDRVTQLGMEFKTIRFSTAWLRKTYTDEQDPYIQACLAAEEHYRRDRRLQEVRYGNNITLLFKACCASKDFRSSGALWAAISRVFGVNCKFAESIGDLFVEARAIYLSNHPPARDTAPQTEATHWVDTWVSFLKQDHTTPPPSERDISTAVDDFFRKEKAKNGDLACILETAIDPPAAPRAPRKRSPSASAFESTPNTKKRAVSTSMDWTRPQATCADLRGKEEPHDPVSSMNGGQYPNVQSSRTSQEESYFGLKIRGQAQRQNHNSPSYQDHHFPEGENCEALVQSNMELQDRVESLEKERLESIRAQKERDNAIRTLQARFTAFEKTSVVADTYVSVTDRLVREVREMTEKLGTQAARLQEMKKQLEVSDQTSRNMQATISSLQNYVATRAQPTNDGSLMTGVAATEAKTEREEVPEAQKKRLSEMLVRIASLEAKSVFFNDLHKTVREIKADIAAQKDKAAAPTLGSTNEPNKQNISTKLEATEKATKRQDQTIQRTMDRVLTLEGQVAACNARIASLESRPDTAKDMSRLESRVSTVEQNQNTDFKVLDCRLVTTQEDFEQTRGNIKQLSKRLDEMGNLPLVQFIIGEMQTKIAHIEEHGTEVSKRLDDMEVSHDALTLHDQSSRIDELSQSLETLKILHLSLAKSDDVEALRTELKALSQKQSVDSQQVDQDERIHAAAASMFQSLNHRIKRLDDMYENHVSECQARPEQLDWAGNMVRDVKHNNVAAVVESLCQRVSIMENGFQIMRDAVSGRRR